MDKCLASACISNKYRVMTLTSKAIKMKLKISHSGVKCFYRSASIDYLLAAVTKRLLLEVVALISPSKERQKSFEGGIFIQDRNIFDGRHNTLME